MSENKVFIPHVPSRYDTVTDSRIPTIDLNPAKEHGELIPCLPTDTVVSHGDLQPAIERIRETIKDITEHDYILIAGDVVCNAFAVQEAFKHVDHLQLLRWSRQDREYYVVHIDN